MSFGISNFEAVDAWKKHEALDLRHRKVSVNTDGIDLRVNGNVVVRRIGAQSQGGGKMRVWTMCGRDTVSTRRLIRTAIDVHVYRKGGDIIRATDETAEAYPIHPDTPQTHVTLMATMAVHPSHRYTEDCSVKGVGWRAPARLRGRSVADVGNSFDHPVIGFAAEVLSPLGPGRAYRQVMRRTASGAYQVYIPTRAEETPGYAAAVYSVKLRCNQMWGVPHGANFSTTAGYEGATRMALDLRVEPSKSGPRLALCARVLRAGTPNSATGWACAKRTLAVHPLRRGRWHDLDLSNLVDWTGPARDGGTANAKRFAKVQREVLKRAIEENAA